MRNKVLILPFFFMLISVNCNKDDNPIIQVESKDGYNKLLIETDSLAYKWQPDESRYSIIINVILKNETDTVFYSKIGDRFSGDTPCCFAGNSDAYLEKFDRSEKVWKVENLASLLIEGTKIVPIEPSQEYFISSFLQTIDGQNETGTYRFRLEYYNKADPDSNVVPYFDYSNEFNIEQER